MALMSHREPLLGKNARASKVGVVTSGGNVDLAWAARRLAR